MFNPFEKKGTPTSKPAPAAISTFEDATYKKAVETIKPVEEPKKKETPKNMDSDNYDDDDFDIGESLPNEDNSGEDPFNQNKNFTGGLKNLGIGKDTTEKESEKSGLGFDDNYDF